MRWFFSASLLLGGIMSAQPLMAGVAASAVQAGGDAGPVLLDAAAFATLGQKAEPSPLFDKELARVRKQVDAAMREGIDVPVPKGAGGAPAHEQHKRNYATLYGAGLLYRITGNKAYADYARQMLLSYAKLYPTLGQHPDGRGEAAGRLFWQSLNDSVWLVYGVQGYDAIRDTLSPEDRKTIDDRVFRPMVAFLMSGKTFGIIHNHATWACAGVGMTGYVLRDRTLADKALKGLDLTGTSGFLRQIDELFSPDGYYTEGPYYQRYAIHPFMVLAHAIAMNDPAQGIFARRDGVLLKATRATIQQTYGGFFFPLNDALADKSLKTDELYASVAIAYGQTHDPAYLSVAKGQGRTTLSPEGLAVARDVAGGKDKPFPFASTLLRDGPNGDQGAMAILRSGSGDDAQVLVAKNTAQGMGHGHFDRLSWILYDNGAPIVTDYGAARFLNVEAKDGGRYLAENESWAKQTIAHNTLVVNQTSDFGGDWRQGQTKPARQIFYADAGATRISTSRMDDAWPGVRFRRTLAQLTIDGLKQPVVLDLLTVQGDKPAQYDLPLHYAGQFIDTGFPLTSHVAERPVLGAKAGYQHLWVDATGTPGADNATFTWLNGGRFYTYRMLPPAGASVIFAESGANDPKFDLRREPVLIERVSGAKDAAFVSLLEPHGAYDPSAETTTGSTSRIRALAHVRAADADLVTITQANGHTTTLAVADNGEPTKAHHAVIDGKAFDWKGHWGRFEGAAK